MLAERTSAGTRVAQSLAMPMPMPMPLPTSPSWDTHAARDVALYRSAPPGTRVLLAEDDDDLRELFSRALRAAHYAVLAAGGGSAMLGTFSAVSKGDLPSPSAVVMDVRMPQHSGLALLRALRLAEWRVPVLLVTGHPDEQMVERAEAYGVAAVLSKPVSALSLCRSVREAIAGAQLQGSIAAARR